ncbi:hypothetical protein QFZ68_006722 [Streptomyces sp. V1I6]|nr:hypothetical protein [Streptomyces sp. V1I6]
MTEKSPSPTGLAPPAAAVDHGDVDAEARTTAGGQEDGR